jgi:hypothetical protein
MQIKTRPEFAKLPNGLLVAWPTQSDYHRARMLTKRQEAMWEEMAKLNVSTEEGSGRFHSIKRSMAKLEGMKHPCLQIQNSPLFPDEYRRV